MYRSNGLSLEYEELDGLRLDGSCFMSCGFAIAVGSPAVVL